MKVKVVCVFCGKYYYTNQPRLTKEDIECGSPSIDASGIINLHYACENCYFKPCNEPDLPPELIECINEQLVKHFNADTYVHLKTEDNRHFTHIIDNKKKEA